MSSHGTQQLKNQIMPSSQFKCLLSNDSFEIFWIINDSDAEFVEFKREGISVASINATSSELHIPGQRRYNHTEVQCAALLYHNNVLIHHELSNIALLTILGKYLDLEINM